MKSAMGSFAKYDVHAMHGRWLSIVDPLVYEAAARSLWRDNEHFDIPWESCDLESNCWLDLCSARKLLV